jgi:16S rRNA (cytosine1402-N4)-methyltransferase
MSDHVPVMRDQVLALIDPKPGIYVDSTFGRGGYTKALLDSHPEVQVIGIDRDPDAIAWGRAHLEPLYGSRLTLAHDKFSAIQAVLTNLNISSIQGIMFDLGVSSPQLDQAHRGFSFSQEGPLDMGMGLNDQTASDVLNHMPAEDLSNLLYTLGGEKYARVIARHVESYRKSAPFETTLEFAELIGRVIKRRDPSGIHPATRSFQALRMHVNQELEELTLALEAAVPALAPGGRLVVVSFHSLEDGLTKRFLRTQSAHPQSPNRHGFPQMGAADASVLTLSVPGKQPLSPTREETMGNPRARSARLRWAVRLGSLGEEGGLCK